MEPSSRRIEIFAPFESALSLTKLILFQPFDLGKWCVIGFAAFLASFGGGGGGSGFNFPSRLGNTDWNFRAKTHEALGSTSTAPEWLIPVLIIVALCVVALVLVLMWVGARGQFIFADCVVKNRGAIVEPWKEYKREGDRLFFLRLAVGLVLLVMVGLAAMPLWLPFALHGTPPEGAAFVIGIALVVCVAIGLGIPVSMIFYFMVPIMYRRRCRALQGARESIGLILAEPGPVILFFLFQIVLAVAVAFIACGLVCATCCIAALPYVGTVILLPIHVFLMAYLLLFVRQFGPDYDVWAGLAPTVPLAPPVQEAPPPTEPPATP